MIPWTSYVCRSVDQSNPCYTYCTRTSTPKFQSPIPGHSYNATANPQNATRNASKWLAGAPDESDEATFGRLGSVGTGIPTLGAVGDGEVVGGVKTWE